MLDRHPYGKDPDDEEYTLVWLVLADQLWQYGIGHPPTLKRALRIVAEGTDIAMKRALCMSEPNLKQRAKALERLAAKWQTPNLKPRSRRVLARPESFVLVVGDGLTYRLSKGETRNPYVGPRQEEGYYGPDGWNPDGWGATIVLARYRCCEVFARYLVAVLQTDPTTKPSLADFRAAPILHERTGDGTTSPCVHAISTTRQHLQRMRVEILGRLAINPQAVAAAFGRDEVPVTYRKGELAHFAGLEAEYVEAGTVEDPLARYLA